MDVEIKYFQRSELNKGIMEISSNLFERILEINKYWIIFQLRPCLLIIEIKYNFKIQIKFRVILLN